MYCRKCGNPLLPDSQFCNRCGNEVNPTFLDTSLELAAISPSHEKEVEEFSVSSPEMQSSSKLWYWLTAAVFLFGVISVFSMSVYQTNKNEISVKELQKAQHLALKGKWEESLKYYQLVNKRHPNQKVVQGELSLVKFAQDINQTSDKIKKQIDTKQFDSAEKQLEKLSSKLDDRSGKIIDLLRVQINDQKETLSVQKIKEGLPKIQSLEEVYPLLQVISSLSSKQANEVAVQLSSILASLTEKEVRPLLEKNQFSPALALVEKALTSDPKLPKLVSLQSEIKEKQKTFEEEENARMVAAQEQAAEEDEWNRTSAASLTDIHIELDGWGYSVWGTVTNQATRPISNITMYYTITDSDGYYVTDSLTFITPNILYPGDVGTFSTYHYGVYDYLTVTADRFTWNIE
jgi:tetratricopeptide (TPR) repeat protein